MIAKRQKIDILRICRLIFSAAIFFLILFYGIKTVKEGKWDGNRRFTVVVDGNPVLLFSIEPSSKQAVLVTIPANAMIDVPYGYSTFPASAVFKLGNLDPQKGGGKLLSKGIENTFGVAVEGFFASKNENTFSFPIQSDKQVSFKKSYFSLTSFPSTFLKYQTISKNLATDLSSIDIFRLWNAIRQLRSDQIAVINLDQSRVATDEKLPDGSMVKIINQDLVNQMISSDFQDQLVRLQNISVEVVNATDIEKVASQFARILQNMGVNVVVKSTAVDKEQFNCITFVSKKYLISSIIVERLAKFYQCKVEMGKDMSVSDIKIVLGEEFIK